MSLKNPKILVVDATGAERGRRRFSRDAIGSGPRSICGVLEQMGIQSRIQLAEDVLEKGFEKEYSTLFISAMSMDKVAVRKLIILWRKGQKGKKIVLGGPITSEMEGTFYLLQPDFMVIGEGEETVKELIQKNAFGTLKKDNILKNIPGIIFLSEKNEVVKTGFRKYSTGSVFNSYRASTKKIHDYTNHSFAKVYVECVRGCSNFKATTLALPNGKQCSNCGLCESEVLEERQSCPEGIPPGCGFCSVPNLFGPARSRKIEYIAGEVKELLTLGVKRIILSAPDFLDFAREEKIVPKLLLDPKHPPANIERIEELLKNITILPEVTQKKAWVEIENIKANLFTEQIAQIISRYLPNSSFSVGCETGSEKHAKELGKASTPVEVFQAVKIAYKYGLNVHVYFIHSLPGQTEETTKETIAFMKKIEPFISKITIYRFRPLPMSAFGDYPEPPAAVGNLQSKKMVEVANEINIKKKRELIGKIKEVMISEPNIRDPHGVIAVMLEGGPKVAMEGGRERIGEITEVEIVKALSDRLVLGKEKRTKEF